MTRLPLIVALAGVTALTACQQRDEILPGERLSPRAVLSESGTLIEGNAAPTTSALSLPALRANADWPQRAGGADHAPGNVALGAGTTQIWAAPIGRASDRRHRISAEPVVAGGVIYTLDSQTTVTATAANGGRVFSADIRPPAESVGSVSGGGLAYDGGRVFATTAYGEIVALDARSGAIIWRQKLDASVSSAPTVAGGIVYALGRDGTAWAVRATDGKVQWRAFGNIGMAGVMGASAPAVAGGTAVFPMQTGELYAASTSDGAQRWSANIAGSRLGRSVGYFRDITGDPVISGGAVIAGTNSGRIVSVDMETGMQNWSAREGASSTPLVAGNSVFVVNDQAQLVRLDRSNGARVWAQKLPLFKTNLVRRQSGVFTHFGPVLAGNRLYLASSDGYLRVFDPATGALIGNAEIPGGAAAAPAVAGQTLYVVSNDGQLIAYR